MDFSFLPVDMQIALGVLNINKLSEIRLKNGQPVIIAYNGEYKYLKLSGECDNADQAIVCDSAEKIFERAMKNSVYAYAEQLKCGFITIDGGIRIGVGGEYVTQNGSIVSLRDVSSLNIRIPHQIIGCAKEIFNEIQQRTFNSLVIFSPPGFGKTTVLRDFIRLISKKGKERVLIADERNEICGAAGGLFSFDLGANCDVVSGANKKFVFENSVRVLSPTIIATDEIYGESDYQAIKFLNECGIKFIATSHVCDKNVLKQTCAKYFVELTGIGCRANIYDKDFNFICDCNTVGVARSCSFGREEKKV